MNRKKRVKREVRRFRDRVIRRRRVDAKHPLVIFAAFPKSASLFLLKLIAKGTNYKPRSVRLAEGGGQAIIDRQRFKGCLDGRTVVYGHMPCNSYTRDLIRRFERRVLVSVRPLPEVVVSLKDHIDAKGDSPLDPKVGNFPEYYPGYAEADVRTQMGYIIDYLMPWYFQFLVSWIEESKSSRIMWIPYEDIADRPIETVAEVARFCGTQLDEAALATYLAGDPKVNFNKGVRGRGLELLDQGLQDKLAALAAYHRPYIDEQAMDYLLHGKLSQGFRGFGNSG